MPRMKKSEMAVAVAKDVIEQLNKTSKKYVATCNTYIESAFKVKPSEFDEIKGDLQDFIDKIQSKNCKVCALGSALLSKARLFDKVPANKYLEFYDDNKEIEVVAGRDDIVDNLKDVFTPHQLDLIEAAFEQNGSRTEITSEAEINGATVFGMNYGKPKDRLIAIMQNIIDNNGKFVVKNITSSDMRDSPEYKKYKKRQERNYSSLYTW